MKRINLKNFLLIGLIIVITGCNSPKSDWETAVKTNTIEAYNSFLSAHPKSEFDSLAHRRIDSINNIIIKSDWENALKSNTIKGYDDFLSAHPKSEFDSLAKNMKDFFGPDQKPMVELTGILAYMQMTYSGNPNKMFNSQVMTFIVGDSKWALLTSNRTIVKNLQITQGKVGYIFGNSAKYLIRGRYSKPGEFNDDDLAMGQHYFVTAYIEYLGN